LLGQEGIVFEQNNGVDAVISKKNMCASPLAEGNLAVAVSQEMPDLKEN